MNGDDESIEWYGELCADVVREPDNARIHGGSIHVGSSARIREGEVSAALRPHRGERVRVERIAEGLKGKGVFRKRLWVALQVRLSDGTLARALASDLERVLS